MKRLIHILASAAVLAACAPLPAAENDIRVPSENASGGTEIREINITPIAETILDDTSLAAIRTTLGLVIGTDVLAPDGDGSGLTGLLWSQLGSPPTDLAGYGITDAATAAQGALADTALQPEDGLGAIDGLASSLNQKAQAYGVYVPEDDSIELAAGSQDFGLEDWSVSWVVGLDDYTPGSDGLLWASHDAGNSRVSLSVLTSGDWRLTFTDDSAVTTNYDLSPSLTDGETYAITITADRDGLATLYVNGVSVDSVDISAEADVDVGDGNSASGILLGDELSGTMRDFAALNFAASAADAAEIARGVQAWRGRHPELGTAQIFASGLTSWAQSANASYQPTSLVSSDYSEFSVVNDGSKQVGLYAGISPHDGVGVRYRITYTATLNSGTLPTAYWLFQPTSAVTSGNLTSGQRESSLGDLVEGTNSTVVTMTDDISSNTQTRLTAYFEASTSDITVSDITVTRLGPLSLLPHNEGTGYQLRDLTDNHNDALLTDGISHLLPKLSGSIRDFNLDANGATVDVVDGSRDILPENAIIDRIILRNNDGDNIAAAAFGVNRADGTNTAEIADNAYQIDAGDAGVIWPDVTQDLADRRIEIPSTADAGMDDFDIEIFFSVLP